MTHLIVTLSFTQYIVFNIKISNNLLTLEQPQINTKLEIVSSKHIKVLTNTALLSVQLVVKLASHNTALFNQRTGLIAITEISFTRLSVQFGQLISLEIQMKFMILFLTPFNQTQFSYLALNLQFDSHWFILHALSAPTGTSWTLFRFTFPFLRRRALHLDFHQAKTLSPPFWDCAGGFGRGSSRTRFRPKSASKALEWGCQSAGNTCGGGIQQQLPHYCYQHRQIRIQDSVTSDFLDWKRLHSRVHNSYSRPFLNKK
ncbi:Hypothetical_protein [Hexamita inflata]|uniref:Hypothetical_protein n=1 Tax=Hexamita inflata TaxID=28002 RepID=A0AA86RCI1_9EUKA|nr:Hypothetical protein HINF_LOCUS61437 [Hexamita inflata]